jgi:cyclopropane-fatty-acyl-phospholipid synthase
MMWSSSCSFATPPQRDDEHFRIWRVYLAGCSYAFKNDDVSIYQVICRKAGCSAKTLQWSRRYIYKNAL